MKIAMCAPVDIHWLARANSINTEGVPRGLGSTATTPLILELARRRHELTIYTLDYDSTEEQFYEWSNLRIFVGPSRRLGAARNFFRPEIAYLRRVIETDCPAFVHAHWTYEFALAALGSGVQTLVTIHDLPWNVLRYFRDRYRTARLLMAYAVAMRANLYTAVSEDAARHFSRYMRPGARVLAIPNFLSETVLTKANGFQTHPDRPLVFACILQGWSPRKNAKAALRAFALFRKNYSGSRLLFMGADYQAVGPAEAWAREHGLQTDVLFCGLQPYDKMLERVRDEVDVLVMPSLDEALSMTVLENMAFGKPIIAGRSTPGISEELDGGRAGVLVDVGRPGDIAEAMTRLQNDTSLFERIAEAAYQRAHTIYTAERVVPLYERLYEQVASTLTPHSPISLEGVL